MTASSTRTARRSSASDFEHTIKRVLNLESGGSSFYEVIVGAEEYLKGGEPEADITGIETDDKTGEIGIKLRRPAPTSRTSWR